MSVNCKQCGETFESIQKLGGHVRQRHGTSHAAASRPASTPASSSASSASSSASREEEQVRAEEARLKLRQLEQAHRQLDDEELERLQKETRASREAEERRAQAWLEEQARRRHEKADQARHRRRREMIQLVKDHVIGDWRKSGYSIPPGVKAQALEAIEIRLSGLPVDELPPAEVLAIAAGVRDALYQPVLQAQDEARAREEDQRRRGAEEAARRSRQAEADRAEAERKRALIQHGVAFVREDLEEHDDLDDEAREEIMTETRRALEDRLSGAETEADVEGIADEVLADEFGDDEPDEDPEDSEDEAEDDD